MQCWRVRGEERPSITKIESQLTHISTKLPSVIYPTVSSAMTTLSPRSTEPTYTTFVSPDLRRPMPVAMERYSYTSLNDTQVTRHSGASMISDAILRRSNGAKKRSSGHLSATSIRKSGDHLSLSFSILSDNDDDTASSGSGSDNEGDGSFPSTLKSTRSTTTGTATDSQPLTAGSIVTLHQSSPLGLYPPGDSSDIASKTSTMEDSISARSSVVLQPTNHSTSGTEHSTSGTEHSTSGTDRSSFYSTGIDSISTTFSTPLPNSAPINATPSIDPINAPPSIELKTMNISNDNNQLNKPVAMETSSASPVTGKSTDSGIRIDEELCLSNGHVTETDTIVPLRNDHIKLQPAISNVRDSSHASRTSFGLGLSDMSSELMAAFEQFSFK